SGSLRRSLNPVARRGHKRSDSPITFRECRLSGFREPCRPSPKQSPLRSQSHRWSWRIIDAVSAIFRARTLQNPRWASAFSIMRMARREAHYRGYKIEWVEEIEAPKMREQEGVLCTGQCVRGDLQEGLKVGLRLNEMHGRWAS